VVRWAADRIAEQSNSIYFIILPFRWKEYVSPKLWYVYTTLQCLSQIGKNFFLNKVQFEVQKSGCHIKNTVRNLEIMKRI